MKRDMRPQRYEAMFAGLSKKREGAFIPFIMLGDPGIEESVAVVETLIRCGADALELGIPFSDAVADGPVIQRAANRALAAGVTPLRCFEALAHVRQRHPQVPIGLLVYANLIVHRGLPAFYEAAARAGVDSVLAADVPTSSSAPFAEAAMAAGIDPVFVVPPNAGEATLRDIACLGRGYTYFQGRAGVTGADRAIQASLLSQIGAVKHAGAAPAVVGFGISTPGHVRAALAAGAAGAIAGSAVVELIERHLDDGEAMHEALAVFVKAMKAATRVS